MIETRPYSQFATKDPLSDMQLFVHPETRHKKPTVNFQEFVDINIRIEEAMHALEFKMWQLPHDVSEPLLEQMEEEAFERRDGRYAQFLTSFLQAKHSAEFDGKMVGMEIAAPQVKEYLTTNISPLLPVMVTNRETFGMQLGILFSRVQLHELPEEVEQHLSLTSTITDILQPRERITWHLCTSAEERMEQAIEDTGVITVEELGVPYFLVKFKGKMSALCVQDIITPEGTVFLAGNWYSPQDERTRDMLKGSFDEGRGVMPLQRGTWAFMREARSYRHEGVPHSATKLIDNAISAAWTQPEVHDDDMKQILLDRPYSRRQYRSLFSEHWNLM